VQLNLDEEESEVLHFILDTTLQDWEAQKDGQLGLIADDPTLTLEQAMGVSLTISEMNTHAKRIKAKLEQGT
jgi:hypothetical protein